MQRQKSIISFFQKPSPEPHNSGDPLSFSGRTPCWIPAKDHLLHSSSLAGNPTTKDPSVDEVRGTDTPPEEIRRPFFSSISPAKDDEGDRSAAQSFSSILHRFVRDGASESSNKRFFADMEDDIVPDGSSQAEDPPQHGGGGPDLAVIDYVGVLTRRRGKAICKDIRDLDPGTRAIIEVNNDGQPCNVPASTLLTSFLGVLVRDCFMAPISFTDWRSPALELYKKKMIAEVEAKFSFPSHIQIWIRQALGNKWRAYKTSLKAKYWDPTKSLEEIIAKVPDGIDAVQWATLVTHWNEPRQKERSTQNTANAKKLTCPHTGGRKSIVRKQQETAIKDRLLIWRINRLHKDGSWVTEEAKQKWDLACAILAAKDLTPEDGDAEENENVFRDVMGPEHPGRVRCKGFGITPSKYFHEGFTSSTTASYMSTSSAKRFSSLESEVCTIKTKQDTMEKTMGKMYKLMKKMSKKKRGN